MLAGDAAGFVNPLTGEGIEYALESGELAGRVVVQAAQLGSSFSRHDLVPYTWACDDQLRGSLRLNGWLRHVFAVPWLLDRLGRAGNRSKALCEDVARIALAGHGARFTARMAWGCPHWLSTRSHGHNVEVWRIEDRSLHGAQVCGPLHRLAVLLRKALGQTDLDPNALELARNRIEVVVLHQ